jgi:hypothetical protein
MAVYSSSSSSSARWSPSFAYTETKHYRVAAGSTSHIIDIRCWFDRLPSEVCFMLFSSRTKKPHSDVSRHTLTIKGECISHEAYGRGQYMIAYDIERLVRLYPLGKVKSEFEWTTPLAEDVCIYAYLRYESLDEQDSAAEKNKSK